MDNIEHIQSLTQSTQEVLDKSLEERIQKCNEAVWIPYPKANQIIQEIDSLFYFPQKDRMPNLSIVGGTNNGKTSILNRIYAMHPNFFSDTTSKFPVIHFSAPLTPSPNALYEKILNYLKMPYGVNDSTSRKEYQVIRALQSLKTKLIVIDEFQDIYHGSMHEQRKFLAAVKHLGNELKISIVVAGIPEVQRTLNADPQTANRFETMHLEKWKLDKEFARLLMSFEKTLPLKEASILHSHEMRAKLHEMSEGTLGEVATILRKATIWALTHGKEKIEMNMLDSIDYHRPRDRRR